MKKVLLGLLIAEGLFAQRDNIDFSIANPSAVNGVSVFQTGVAGTTTYYYIVVANYPSGSVLSQPVAITNANSTLNGSNFDTVIWNTQPTATNYDLLRSTSPTISLPCTACAVATGITGNSQTDQSNTVAAYSNVLATTAGAAIRLNNRDFTAPRLEWYVGNVIGGAKLFGPLPVTSGGTGIANGTAVSGYVANQLCLVGTTLGFCNTTQMPAAASAVNQLTLKDAGTGVGPTLVATGTDAAIPLNLSSKSTANINLLAENSGVSLAQFQDTASGINFPVFKPGATGNPYTVSVGTTTDAVVDGNYTCKGTGCAVIIPNGAYNASGNATTAQVNAGIIIVPAVTGHTLKLVHFYLAARGGAAATCTDVRLGDSNFANAIVIDPVANLTQNTGNTEGTSTIAQSGFGATAFTANLGIGLFKSGSACATATSFDYEVEYTVNY